MYLCNRDPREYDGVDIDWLEGNCVFVHVNKTLFVPTSPPGTPSSRNSEMDRLLMDIEIDTEFN